VGQVGRHDLGRLLRAWRERVAPATVGVAASARRGTPGLRREELALLAGVSADYVKRLEQGRARPSVRVVDALSRALRLSRAEYEHLCTLAGHAAPGAGRVPTHIGPGAHRLLDRLGAGPVGVFTAAWTLLATNSSWAALFRDSTARGRELNLVWSEFTGPRTCVEDPADAERFQASLVVDLRAAAARYPADRSLTELVAALCSASDRFARLWHSGLDLAGRAVHRALVVHPLVGPLSLDFDIVTIDDGDLRVALFTAEPGSADAERLALVEVLGLQDLSADEPAQA
jgi:transcriptional regulator with XRE-family HTH domain